MLGAATLPEAPLQTVGAAASAVALGAVCNALLAGSVVLGRASDGPPASDARPAVTGRSRLVGYGLWWAGLVVALWAGVGGWLPPAVPVVVVAGGLAFVAGRRVAPERTPRPIIAAIPVTGAVVVAAAAAPLSGLALPDIGVLGPYTYLATEVAFGGVAVALLARAGRDALRTAACTILVLYPVAYLWDWYTLEVGVFAITLRTGVELVGIPVEEHLFMVVVPAFVLGIHETLRAGDSRGPS